MLLRQSDIDMTDEGCRVAVVVDFVHVHVHPGPRQSSEVVKVTIGSVV